MASIIITVITSCGMHQGESGANREHIKILRIIRQFHKTALFGGEITLEKAAVLNTSNERPAKFE
jgi:hypothetical protein